MDLQLDIPALINFADHNAVGIVAGNTAAIGFKRIPVFLLDLICELHAISCRAVGCRNAALSDCRGPCDNAVDQLCVPPRRFIAFFVVCLIHFLFSFRQICVVIDQIGNPARNL